LSEGNWEEEDRGEGEREGKREMGKVMMEDSTCLEKLNDWMADVEGLEVSKLATYIWNFSKEKKE
jgi:hypothetical protein